MGPPTLQRHISDQSELGEADGTMSLSSGWSDASTMERIEEPQLKDAAFSPSCDGPGTIDPPDTVAAVSYAHWHEAPGKCRGPLTPTRRDYPCQWARLVQKI